MNPGGEGASLCLERTSNARNHLAKEVKKMVKMPLSMDIEPEAFQEFHSVCDMLPLNKNEVMALMIRVFVTLPVAVQDQLCSKRPGVADDALKKLSEIGTDSALQNEFAAAVKRTRKRDARKSSAPQSA